VLTRLKDQLAFKVSQIEERCSEEKLRIEKLRPKEDPQAMLNRTVRISKLRKEIQEARKEQQKMGRELETENGRVGELEHMVKVKEEEARKKREVLERSRREKEEEDRKKEEMERIENEKREQELREAEQKRLQDERIL
jgi:hypothetical protein